MRTHALVVGLSPVLLLLAVGRAEGQGPCTGLAASVTTLGGLPDSMRSMVEGDFDGDGLLDVVTVSRQFRVQAYLNGGNGAFTPQPVVEVTGVGLASLARASGDFNGDGKADVAVVSGGQVAIVWGDGQGGFVPQATLVGSALSAGVLVAADLDRDGWLDLVSADASGAPVVAFNDHGQFGAFIPAGPAGSAANAVAVADANGDGRPDLACLSGGAVTVVLSLPGRLFHTEDPVAVTVASARSVVMGNMSGRPGWEFAVMGAVGEAGSVAVYRRTLAGELGAPDVYAVPLQGTLRLVDFDGDGDLDLVVPSLLGGPAASLLANAGNGTFLLTNDGMPMEPGSGLFSLSAVGDFTGDGLPDVVLDQSMPSLGVRLFRNTTRVALAEQPRDVVLRGGADYAAFHVAPPEGDVGAAVRWQVQRAVGGAWEDLSDGGVEGLGQVFESNQFTLQVSGVPASASGWMFRARVSTTCRPFVSAAARLTVEGPACPADFNGDGFIDFFDYDDFIGAFESGC